MMALGVAWTLAVIYAVAVPLGRRVDAAGVWAVRTLAPPGSEGVARRASRLVMGGWYALLNADLWLLPFLGALILLFEWWWMSPILLAAAFALRWVADRVLPYPNRVEWYLERFLSEVEKRAGEDPAADEIARGLGALIDLYDGAGCTPPTLAEARSAPAGEPRWLLDSRR